MKVKSESESRNHHHTRPITVGAKSVYESVYGVIEYKDWGGQKQGRARLISHSGMISVVHLNESILF